MGVRSRARLAKTIGRVLASDRVGSLGSVGRGLVLGAELAEGRLVQVLNEYDGAGPPVHALCKPGQQSVAKVRAFGKPTAVLYDVKGMFPKADVDARL